MDLRHLGSISDYKAEVVKPDPQQLNILQIVLEQNGRLLEANIRLMEIMSSTAVLMNPIPKEQDHEA